MTSVAEPLCGRFVDEPLHPSLGRLVRLLGEGGDGSQEAEERGRQNPGSHGGKGACLPNGSRLSCGRHASGRKELEPQTKRLASEATEFFPTCERPAASSAC